jgi:hypothetical protein
MHYHGRIVISVRIIVSVQTVIKIDGLFFAFRHRSPCYDILQFVDLVQCCLAAITGRAMATFGEVGPDVLLVVTVLQTVANG